MHRRHVMTRSLNFSHKADVFRLLAWTLLFFVLGSINVSAQEQPYSTASSHQQRDNPRYGIDNGSGLITGGIVNSSKDISICNDSDDEKIWVAYVTSEDDNLRTKGWRKIENGNCSIIWHDYFEYEILFYAEGQSGPWPGSTLNCVHPTDRFDIEKAEDRCPQGYQLAPFKRRDVTGTRNLRIWLGER